MIKSFYIVHVLTMDRKLYEEAFDADTNAPLYSAPWWLDATCSREGWKIISSGVPLNVMIPYCVTKIRGMKAFINPPLSQWLPVLKINTEEGYPITEMLRSISHASILDISLKPLPGIALTDIQLPVHVKYTYLIDGGSPIEQIRAKYNEGLRRNLKEARQVYTVTRSDDVNSLLTLCRATYAQRSIKMPPWFESVVPRVFDGLKKHHCGYLSFIHHDGKMIAGIMIGHDNTSAYYLAGGRTGDEGGTSAHALLLDQAISEAVAKGLNFDFEGSMHPGVANFFQSFGGAPSPYWHIRKLRGMARIWGVLHP